MADREKLRLFQPETYKVVDIRAKGLYITSYIETRKACQSRMR